MKAIRNLAFMILVATVLFVRPTSMQASSWSNLQTLCNTGMCWCFMDPCFVYLSCHLECGGEGEENFCTEFGGLCAADSGWVDMCDNNGCVGECRDPTCPPR